MSAQTPRASGDLKDAAAPLETATGGEPGAAKPSVRAPPLPQVRPATSRPPPLPSVRPQAPAAPPAPEGQPAPGTAPAGNAPKAPQPQAAIPDAPRPQVLASNGEVRLHVSVKASVRDPQLLIVRPLAEGQPAPPGSREAFLVLVGGEANVTGGSGGSSS